VDFSGKRVAIIGTGSSAIQSIPIIAWQAAHLYVFQRTPIYTIPAHNGPLDPKYQAAVKADYACIRARAKQTFGGLDFKLNMESALAASEEERQREFEKRWAYGGLPFIGAFGDLLYDHAANDLAAEFVRLKIREVVHDPQVAEMLSPSNVIGCKRLCVDTGWHSASPSRHPSSPAPTRSLSEKTRVDAGAGWCDCLCAYPARAAEGNAGDRLPQQRLARPVFIVCGRVPPWAERNRLCRGKKRCDRIPLGGGKL